MARVSATWIVGIAMAARSGPPDGCPVRARGTTRPSALCLAAWAGTFIRTVVLPWTCDCTVDGNPRLGAVSLSDCRRRVGRSIARQHWRR